MQTRMVEEFFATSLVEAVGSYEKLLDFLGQYLKFRASESKENWYGH